MEDMIEQIRLEAGGVSQAAEAILKLHGDLAVPAMKEPLNRLVALAKTHLGQFVTVGALPLFGDTDEVRTGNVCMMAAVLVRAACAAQREARASESPSRIRGLALSERLR